MSPRAPSLEIRGTRQRRRVPTRAAPPTQAAPPAIDAFELERIRAAVGVVPAAPAEPSVVADDEDAFDPDDYPEFDVEEV